MRRRHVAALAALLSVAAAGCGDSNGSGANEPNGIESKSPQEALRETAAALRRVKSFHVEATEGRSSSITGDVAKPTKLRFDLKQGDGAARMLFVDGDVYIRGNTAFWRDSGTGRQSGELDGRWLKVPSSVGGLDDLAKQTDPANLSRCLLKGHGTLARGGTATVDGQPAVVIVDKGDRPGTAPGRLYVAATGEPLPLRTIATGRQRPGGEQDPLCGSDSPTEKGDEVLFSRYDEPVEITAPPNALDLSGIGGGTPS